MGIFKRNRTFLVGAVMILVVGALLFGGVIAVRVMAESGATPAPAATQPASYNSVSSFGMTGYEPLTIEPTADTPEFITKRLDEKRGIVLLVYVQGASDDMEMLSYFNDVKANYSADSSFFSFEARESKQLGDTLTQLRVSRSAHPRHHPRRRHGGPTLHRLDRPEGHGAGGRRRGPRSLTAGTDAPPQTAPSGAPLLFDRPSSCGSIMPTLLVGIRQQPDDGAACASRRAANTVCGRWSTLPVTTVAGPCRCRRSPPTETIPGAVPGAHPRAAARGRPRQGDARGERRLPACPAPPPTSPSGMSSRRWRARCRWSAAFPTTGRAPAPTPARRGSCGAAGQRHQRRSQRHHPRGSDQGGSVTMKPVYFDHAATTPVDPQVLEVMLPYFSQQYGNPSELHRLGREARAAVEAARAQVAEVLGAGEKEIVFTAGGTESDNLALFGSLARHQPGHLIVSAVEHPAVMEAARALNRLGWAIDFIPVDGDGIVDLDAYEQAFRDDTRLVVHHVRQQRRRHGAAGSHARADRAREGRPVPHRRRAGGRVAADRRRRARRRHAEPLRPQALRAQGRRRAVREAWHAPAADPARRRPRAPAALRHGERTRHRRAGRGHDHGGGAAAGGPAAPRARCATGWPQGVQERIPEITYLGHPTRASAGQRRLQRPLRRG